MKNITLKHLQAYGWSGTGMMSPVEMEQHFTSSELDYFDKAREILQDFEGLRIFTLSVNPECTAVYLEDVNNTPLYENQKNTFISMNVKATLDYFGGYHDQPPYSCLVGRQVCPVGLWMDCSGHGFILIDEDGMLYNAGHTHISVISDSMEDFWDRLVLMTEKFTVDKEKYTAIIDMTLHKD